MLGLDEAVTGYQVHPGVAILTTYWVSDEKYDCQ